MHIYINNKEKVVDADVTLQNTLENNNIFDFRGIAIAVNDIVIPKREWSNHPIRENDRILIIRATQGG